MERPSEISRVAQPVPPAAGMLATDETWGFQIADTCPTCGGEMKWSGDAGSFDDCRCLDFIVCYCVQCGDYFCVDPCSEK